MSAHTPQILILMAHFFVSAAVLGAVWFAIVASLVRALRLHAPRVRMLLFAVPLLAAFGARLRMAPEAAWEIVGLSLAVALSLMAVEIRHYRRFVRALGRELVPAPALQALVDELAPAFGLRRRPLAYESLTVGAGPCALGLRAPMLVVPRAIAVSMERDELRALIAHELAHVRWNDGISKWVLLFLRRLAFLNPAAHWAHRRVGLEIERACDLEAVRATGRPGALARALVKSAAAVMQTAAPAARLQLANVPRAGTELADRIGALAAYRAGPRTGIVLILFKAAAVLVTFAVLCLRPGALLLAVT